MQISGMPEGLIWPQFEDGTPVNIGDCVVNKCGIEIEVANICLCLDGNWKISSMESSTWLNNGEKCKRPFDDSWEKLEKDAKKHAYYYWNCEEYGCQACPSKINGKKPDEYYDCCSCAIAARIDVVTRAKKIVEHERNQR